MMNSDQTVENESLSLVEEFAPVLDDHEAKAFRSRWLDVQTGFVDDPRASVEKAEELVADMMKSITRNFGDRRSSLEDQWGWGDSVSTEDLRNALIQYRSFFNRLLTLEFPL